MTDASALRGLLTRPDLRLDIILDEAELDPGALDAPIRWVHSSDLPDPTPFLPDDLVLLTNGSQLTRAADVDAYVSRLHARGVRALGFGLGVVLADPPEGLVEACRRHRMPLFFVPYDTPFLAIARANAEAITAADDARRRWALSAQRAISLAALRPDALTATITELSHQLQAGVALFDVSAQLTRQQPAPAFDDDVADALRARAREMLRSGNRTGASLTWNGMPLTLQTLGASGRLRGVIAIGGALDDAGRGVVTAVIAMASLALEQNEGLVRERALMRAALLRSLRTGDAVLAERVAHELWGGLPAEPIVVALSDAAGDDVDEWLELRVHDRPGTIFHAADEDGTIIAVPADQTRALHELAGRFEIRLGVSSPLTYAQFERGRGEASLALERGAGAVSFFGDQRRGVLSVLDAPAARVLAHDALAPLIDHDLSDGTALVDTLRAWLAGDTRMDAAAEALGVHRHTVRARLGQVQDLLGVDLGAFPVRAELWAAVRALG